MASPLAPKLSIPSIFSQIDKPYKPKMVAVLNDSVEFKVAKIKGDFVWHSHPTTDELFFILDGGPLIMKIRHNPDGNKEVEEDVVLRKGDLFVVPKGVQHLPTATEEVQVLVAESKGELNTGDLGITERTAAVEDVREKKVYPK